MVIYIDDIFDNIVVYENGGFGVWYTFHPDFDSPAVSVEAGAFSFIVHQAVGCIKVGFLVDAKNHTVILYAGRDNTSGGGKSF